MSLIKQVEDIYQLIADNRIEELRLFRIGGGTISTPIASDMLAYLKPRSKRADDTLAWSVVESIIGAIKETGSFKGLNHIGFCYKVADKEKESKRIVGKAHGAGFSVFQEPSIDEATWLFVGDIAEISNPLLEFLPVAGDSSDKWVDYWLPHIQFDIDTRLTPQEIEALVKRFIDRPFTPYSIQIDGITYIQRVNLGCLEGVNVMLDIATSHRSLQYRKSWTKLTY